MFKPLIDRGDGFKKSHFLFLVAVLVFTRQVDADQCDNVPNPAECHAVVSTAAQYCGYEFPVPLSSVTIWAHQAGIPCQDLVTATAIAAAEAEQVWDENPNFLDLYSCPLPHDDPRAIGLWQIAIRYWYPQIIDRYYNCPGGPFDGYCNATLMKWVYESRGNTFCAWSTYRAAAEPEIIELCGGDYDYHPNNYRRYYSNAVAAYNSVTQYTGCQAVN
jgi:hypothetical protein